ncbi:hypothetical protein JOF56_006251 [Kibdelosporangium banguiense]|uniref:Uncharacterized protein n=1 Tax=Kibdelosporangium banguiense TaxID=1365924 RepID=A0ABS4TN73_9PSEU|nr:hypothetical protein [Kibdelosporangium banguiense]
MGPALTSESPISPHTGSETSFKPTAWRARSAPTNAPQPRSAPEEAPKRVSAPEIAPECPHPRSAWAKPDHTSPGHRRTTAPNPSPAPRNKNPTHTTTTPQQHASTQRDAGERQPAVPWACVVTLGQADRGRAREPLYRPHLREVCPPGQGKKPTRKSTALPRSKRKEPQPEQPKPNPSGPLIRKRHAPTHPRGRPCSSLPGEQDQEGFSRGEPARMGRSHGIHSGGLTRA